MSHSWVKAASFPSNADARAAHEALAAASIPARVEGDGDVVMVLVEPENEARALAVLRVRPRPATSAAPAGIVREVRSVARRPALPWIVTALSLVCCGVLAGMLSAAREELAVFPYDRPMQTADGCVRYFTRGTSFVGLEQCRHPDGSIEQRRFSRKNHQLRSVTVKAAVDALASTATAYDRDGLPYVRAYDDDGDELFERYVGVDAKGVDRATTYDDDGDGRQQRIVQPLAAGGSRVWLDDDGDSLADRFELRAPDGALRATWIVTADGFQKL